MLLTVLNSDKGRHLKKEASFTLSQIVDYCKRRVSWEDVRPIVAMLNVLLRGGASSEDVELVDSIEAEFLSRRLGNVFNAPVGQVVQHVDQMETNKS